MNPVFRKELRTLLRDRRGFLVLMFQALILNSLIALICAANAERGDWATLRTDTATLGGSLAAAVAVCQTIAIGLLSPLIGAGGISGERERGTFLRLLASPIRRRRIASGKAGALALYVCLLVSVSLPASAVAYELGGVELEVIAGMYISHVVLGVTLVVLGLLVSSFFERTWTSALAAISIPAGLVLFNIAVWYALGAPESDPSRARDFTPIWNLGYSLVLFFGGRGGAPLGEATWWLHYGALATFALMAFLWLSRRLGRLRE